jgi:RND superfamily putative drug exporter
MNQKIVSSVAALEGVARTCARHPWTTVAVWLVIVGLAIAANVFLLGGALTNESGFTNEPESTRADQVIAEHLGSSEQVTQLVILRSDTLTVDDPAFKARTESLLARIDALGSDVVRGGSSYLHVPDPSLISHDRRSTVIPVVMAGNLDTATANLDEFEHTVRTVEGEGFDTTITGAASIGRDFGEVAEKDLATGEMFGVGIALVILVLVFGAVVAAVVPLALGIISIVVALGVVALAGQFMDLAFGVTNMITMIGLAVGIDYSLFIVSRYREERAGGLEPLDAIARTGGSASRAVLFSGICVMVALAGMTIVPSTVFQSMGVGAVVVVLVAVAASLTLLPAVLGLLGDRVNALRVPVIGRRAFAASAPGGFWDRMSHAVMRRPVVSLVLATLVLLAAATPYLDLERGANGVDTLPPGTESRTGFEILGRDFTFGLLTPIKVVVEGDMASAEVHAAILELEAAAAEDAAFAPGLQVETAPDGKMGTLQLAATVPDNSEPAQLALERLREDYIPTAFAGTYTTVLVTGSTAYAVDYLSVIDEYTPWVFIFVLGLSFLLLTLVFRSLIVPVKAILMNLLSVAAAYGLIVAVFQHGWGADLLGFQQVAFVEAWIPLFLFAVLFGMSMDYHVFLLSRIRERYDERGDNAESVAFGLRNTAGIITGAAVIMVAVFSGFALGDLVMFQQLGFGLAIAVFLDATIIRIVLVPAAMRLLGDANWWLPRGLRWLPDLRVEPAATPRPAVQAVRVRE